MMDKSYWIEKLNLVKHPEGGYYKEVYRSADELSVNRDESTQGRSLLTSIFFLLDSENYSAFHRIKSDELWYFHTGDAITIHVIDKQGNYQEKILSNKQNENASLFHLVEAGSWFASEVKNKDAFALVSCAVAPGFDFEDFELADERLMVQYPKHKELIKRLLVA